MKAFVYYGPGDIRVEDRPEPNREIDNLVVKVRCCAICGSDLKLAAIGSPRCRPPRIIGHEMVGEIIHVRSDVRGFAVGERITLATTVACGDCPHCALGLGNMCPNAKPISNSYDGAFAEYLPVPPLALSGGNVIKVPDCVDDEWAALAEPLSCAINAQELAGMKAGYRVLILGGGPLGALHAALAKANGAADVMIVQRSQPRISMLRKIDGLTVIDGSNVDVSEIVNGHTSGLGADLVIVCAPSKEAQEKSLEYARKGGAVSLFASLPKGDSHINLDSRLIHYNELRVVGASDSRPVHVEKAIALMAEGKINLKEIVTHRLTLDNIQEGLDLMREKKSLKVMVYPGEILP